MRDSRTRILNAASELFLQGGINALSVRAISAKAGLSTIGIYSHFQGKQGILDALYIEGFSLVSDAMEVAVSGTVTRDNVLAAAAGYLSVGEQHEAHYRLIFGESDAGYQPSPEAVAASEAAFNKLVDLAGAYLGDAASTAQQRRMALDIWAIVHGYVSISHHAVAAKGWDWKAMALDAVGVHIDALTVPRP